MSKEIERCYLVRKNSHFWQVLQSVRREGESLKLFASRAGISVSSLRRYQRGLLPQHWTAEKMWKRLQIGEQLCRAWIIDLMTKTGADVAKYEQFFKWKSVVC